MSGLRVSGEAARNAHATKSGPGRFHKSGNVKNWSPLKPVAPIGSAFVDKTIRNPARAAKAKALKAAGGARQLRIVQRRSRRESQTQGLA